MHFHSSVTASESTATPLSLFGREGETGPVRSPRMEYGWVLVGLMVNSVKKVFLPDIFLIDMYRVSQNYPNI